MVSKGETVIFVRRKGNGAALLLLHGFPETSSDVASPLLRPITRHTPKSAMARDMVRLMVRLGFSRFNVAGHDRGGRVAYRMALNHPDAIERLAVLDIIPTGEAFARADMRLALGYWPWSLLAQPEPLPERLITANPEAVIDDAFTQWGSNRNGFSPNMRARYVDALREVNSVHSICEEYRAAATIDFAEDMEDRKAGRRIACRRLVLWGKDGPLDQWYTEAGGALGIWRAWANEPAGRAIEGGHFFPEHNPEETIFELGKFFGR